MSDDISDDLKKNISAAQILAEMDKEERDEYLRSLSREAIANLKYAWSFWARPNQMQPSGFWKDGGCFVKNQPSHEKRQI